MRKIVLLCVTLIGAFFSHAQVEFAPPGARWRGALFVSYQQTGAPNYVNADIVRTQDSTVDNETVKVLQYNYFYLNRQSDCGRKLLIKQHGDTVFMRNCHTGHNWQILYNFAATVGQSWTTTIMNSLEFGATPVTHTLMVNALSTLTLNGMPLKKLSISICYFDTSGLQCYGSEIMELTGDREFMFNYFNLWKQINYGYLNGFFCYSDNTVNGLQFSSQSISSSPCTYDVGIKENETDDKKLIVWPQPSGQSLNISLGEDNPSSKAELFLSDLSGRLLYTQCLSGPKAELDLSALNGGVYFLNVLRKGHSTITKKIIKE